MNAGVPSTFSSRDFRDAVGMFATGVALVTAAHEANLYGITVNSFASVSLDPPLISVNLDRRLRSLDAFVKATRFSVIILGEGQEETSNLFATFGADKWSRGDVKTTPFGSPIVEPHFGVMECEPHAKYDGGDHIILLGRVMNIIPPLAERPLVFFRGRYESINTRSKCA